MNNENTQTTRKPIQLLMVDDSEDDVYLLNWNLKKQGLNYEHCHVITLSELDKALDKRSWDVVISDHHLIGFTSKEVIELVKRKYPNLPVIIVSGEIQEEEAILAMHRGAQDFVMKDNLSRLIPAILREQKQHESIKERAKLEEDYKHLRYHDNLTNLVNRKEFENRITQILDQAKAAGSTHWLLFLDIDQFKLVNDTCGHTAGDDLLVKTTHILKSCVRERDTLARLGGDEFGVLMENCSEDSAWRVAHAMRDKVKEARFIWQGRSFEITISIGMVEVNASASDWHELLTCADAACNAAKDRGWEGIVRFSLQDEEYTRRRSEMHWAARIKLAVEENHFVLFHQPMANLKPNGGVHSEFLLRLREGDRLIPPGAFMPAAERYNLMPMIDRWVIKNVFSYLKRSGCWTHQEDRYFVNLSGSTLSDGGFFEDVKALQETYQIPPEMICFEITETAAIDNLVDAVAFISETREKGFKFALDDFGVGLSSFSYLKTIPVDYLKIDGSFVLNMLSNSIDWGIVEACNNIAHAAGLQTVAEFVENDEIKQALASLGVDYAQGYGIMKPGPLPEALEE